LQVSIKKKNNKIKISWNKLTYLKKKNIQVKQAFSYFPFHYFSLINFQVKPWIHAKLENYFDQL